MNNLTELNQGFRPENKVAFRMRRHSPHHGTCSFVNMVSVNYSA